MDENKPFFNHTQLIKRRKESGDLTELYDFDIYASYEAFENGPLADLVPFSVAIPRNLHEDEGDEKLGFIIDRRGFLHFRIASEIDAERLGTRIASQREIEASMARVLDMNNIEIAALDAQDRSVKQAALLQKIRPYAKKRHALPEEIAAEIEDMFDEIAEFEAEKEAARKAADRQRALSRASAIAEAKAKYAESMKQARKAVKAARSKRKGAR